jgi:hypothetical protein
MKRTICLIFSIITLVGVLEYFSIERQKSRQKENEEGKHVPKQKEVRFEIPERSRGYRPSSSTESSSDVSFEELQNRLEKYPIPISQLIEL